MNNYSNYLQALFTVQAISVIKCIDRQIIKSFFFFFLMWHALDLVGKTSANCCGASVASVAAVHNCCEASVASVAAVHNLNIKER